MQEVYDTLNERFCETYEIGCFIKFLKYESKNSKNKNSVQQIKNIIIPLIPKICDSVENLDYNELANIVYKVIYARPKNTYQAFFYDREKIFSYLNEYINTDMNQTWGLRCAKNFSKQFAKKWVDIDIDTMQYDEIKLLTITACYLEQQTENKSNN